jgi:16S rRNA processing protein RimM
MARPINSANMLRTKILLGHIAGAHGIKGDVLIKTYTGAPGDIGAYGALSDEAGQRSFVVKVRHVTQNGVVAGIAGVTDRTTAEGLKGVQLHVARERLPPPADGEFYHADLVGLAAADAGGATIGTVVAVRNYGAGDLLEIALSGRRETELVPFTQAFVPEVSINDGRVVVRMPAPPDQSDGPGDSEAGEQ